MEVFLVDHGLTGLFLCGFLAATLVPLGSEWLLVVLLLRGFDPAAAVTVATAGNTAGALTTWLIGRCGGPWLIAKVLRIDDTARRRAEEFYRRFGQWSLLLSWLPVIGDPLCLLGGLLRVRLLNFLLLVTTGKAVRYALVAAVTLTTEQLI